MNQDYFTWVPFYSEFAEKLLSFAKDRSSLIEKIKAVYTAINMRLPKLEKDDHIVDIDPFTVFGLFNKGITDASRIAILQGIANEFSIKAAVPQAFNGIPVLNNQKPPFTILSVTVKTMIFKTFGKCLPLRWSMQKATQRKAGLP